MPPGMAIGVSKAKTTERRPARRARGVEAQAEAAARALDRGEAAEVDAGSAPVAARPRGHGAGVPLPATTRARLEALFGADLAAVRLHADPADRAAVGPGALAVAAGAHVFLGPDAPGPAAPDAAPLLAHEVAHVLQQVGVAVPDGGLTVRPAVGSAAAPAWSVPKGFLDTRSPATPDLFDAAIARLGAKGAAGEAWKRRFEEAKEAWRATDAATFWRERAEHTLKRRADPLLGGEVLLAVRDELVLRFWYDLLKVGDQHEAAAAIAVEHAGVRTTSFEGAAYLAFVEPGGKLHLTRLLDRILWVWDNSPLFQGVRLRDYLRSVVVPLTSGSEPLADLKIQKGAHAGEALRTAVIAELSEPVSLDAPMRNEAYRVALHVVLQLEDARVLLVKRAMDGASPEHVPARLLAEIEAVLAKADALRAGTLPGFEPYHAETRHLLARTVLPALRDAAAFVVSYWEGVAALDTAAAGSADLALREALGGTPEPFPGLQDAWLTFANAALARDPATGALPAPADYAAARDAAARTLVDWHRENVQLPATTLVERILPEGARAPDPTLLPDADRGRLKQAAWLQGTLASFRRTLATYDRFADEEFVQRVAPAVPAANLPAYVADDHRRGDRVRVARGLDAIAEAARFERVRALVAPVLTGTEVGRDASGNVVWSDAQDTLAIFGDFTVDEAAAPGRIRADFQGVQAVRGLEFLTVDELATLFELAGAERATGEIRRSLKDEAATIGADPTVAPLLNQALESAWASPDRPRRWRLPRDFWVYAGPPGAGQPGLPGRRDLLDLVTEHPVVKRQTAGWEVYLVPPPAADATGRNGELVLWQLPSLAGMARWLRQDPWFTMAIAAWQAPPDQPLPADALGLDAIAKLDDAAWWALLERVLQAPEGADEATRAAYLDRRRSLRALVTRPAFGAGGADTLLGALRTARDAAYGDLTAAEIDAIVHERRRRMEHRVGALLASYDPHANAWVEATIAGQKRFVRKGVHEAAYAFHQFVWQIDVPLGRDGHAAAALLQLSGALHARFVAEGGLATADQIDAAYVWSPILEENAAFLDKADAASMAPWLTPEERLDASLVADRKAWLAEVRKAAFAIIERNQERFGFEARAGDGTVENPGSVRDIFWKHDLGAGTPFVVDGIEWEIVRVDVPFTWHPSAIRADMRTVGAGILKIGTQKVAPPGHGQVLGRILRNGVEVPLTADLADAANTAALDALAWGLTGQAQSEVFLQSAEGFEEMMNLSLDVLELVPGEGQVLMATRLATNIAATLADPGMREMVHTLVTHPAAIIDDVVAKAAEYLDPLRLVEFLLFDLPGHFAGLAKPGKGAPVRGTGSFTRRLLARMRRIGSLVASFFLRAQQRVHGAVGRVQEVVLGHPMLAKGAYLLYEWYDEIYPLVQRGAALLPEAKTAFAELTDLATIKGKVQAQVSHLLQMLGKLEIPRVILKFEDVVAAVLETVGWRLGGKYKAGLKLINELLDVAGLKDQVYGQIGTWVKDVLAEVIQGDPNELINGWVERLRVAAEPYVRRVQDGARHAIAGLIGVLPGLDLDLSGIGPDVALTEGEPLPATADDRAAHAQPLLVDRGPQAAAAPRVDAGGAPLPRATRARLEAVLGHDLGHVRVHRDARARGATAAIGAHALTTGSHVLLADGVTPGTPEGDRVLRHEVVHVLQQAGPRAPGRDGLSAPVPGKRGGALRVEARAERAAEAFADRPDRAPPLERLDADGAQPDFSAIGRRFFLYVSRPEQGAKDLAAIDKTGAGTGRALIGREVKADADAFWKKGLEATLVKWAARPTSLVTAKPFDAGASVLMEWLKTRLKAVDDAIEDLAIQSSEVRGLAGASGTTPQMALDLDRFESNVQRYLLLATGLDFDLKLGRTAAGALDRNKPLAGLTLRYVYLPHIPADDRGKGAAVWTEVLKATFKGSPAVATAPDTLARARILAFSLGVDPALWHRTEFRFSDGLRARITNERGNLASEALTASEYWLPNDAGLVQKAHPHALWLNTHGGNTTKGHTTPDRQSHHTTQYLLAEYFANEKNGHRPFPFLADPAAADPFRKLAPAVKENGTKVTAITPLQVTPLDPKPANRGEGMPAIQLAAATHQRGGLHVTASSVDMTGVLSTGSDLRTQADVVDTWFMDGLYRQGPAGLAYYTAVTNVRAGRAPDREVQRLDPALDYGAALTKAALATYHRMHAHMMPRLERGLASIEATYYEALVDRHGKSGTDYAVGDYPAKAFAAAKKYNDDGLNAYGWTPP